MERTVHSRRDNLAYMLKNWWRWGKKSMFYGVLVVPATVALPAITALVPKLMIDLINDRAPVSEMIYTVCIMSFLIACLTWIGPFLEQIVNGSAMEMRMNYRILAFDKMLYTDYGNIESEAGRKKFERGKGFAFGGGFSGGQDFQLCLIRLTTNITGIVSFLAVLSVLDAWILILILATCVLDFGVLAYRNRCEISVFDKANSLFMRFDYYYRLACNLPAGKDVRIYGARDWFIRGMATAVATFSQLLGKYVRQNTTASFFSALLSLIRDVVAYVYLVYCTLNGQITVADFILYFGLVNGFTAWLLGLAYQINNLSRICTECDRYRAFLEIPEKSERGEGIPVPSGEELPCEIEFRDVSFSYAGAKEPTLRHISFHVKKGEKIAIVGENGAGKTTLIKLLCGFYEPTQGEILINGISASNFNREAYYGLFSAVFQDYNFLPLTVAENIAICKREEVDLQRLTWALEQAEVYERVMSLQDGVDTLMNKQIHQTAADFSGGEQQKLLLARAMYKDAPVLVLDEPTAALDPIAENEMYLKYNELTQGKTSFFISHRLSSTRFCDRILFVADGQILEEGTHTQLIETRGRYKHMFDIQSHYYRMEVNVHA